jgi:hypothetical protein
MNNYQREATDAVLDERVTSLLAAAAAPTEPGPVSGEAEALVAFRVSQNRSRRSSMLSSLTTAKAAVAAALSAGLLLTGGVATAMAGALPDGAQDSASNLLGKVGVTVPDAAEAAAADARDTTDTDDADEAAGTAGDEGKGSDISKLARETELTGVDKGAAISEQASGGKSQAGDEHGKAGEHAPDDTSDDAGEADVTKPTQPEDAGEAHAETPENDGTKKADEAPAETADDAADAGQDKADDATSSRGDDGAAERP